MNRILHQAAILVFAATFSLLSSPARAGLEEGLAAYQAGDLPLDQYLKTTTNAAD